MEVLHGVGTEVLHGVGTEVTGQSMYCMERHTSVGPYVRRV